MRKRLPNRRKGIRVSIDNDGQTLHLCTGEYEDGSLGEIFLDCKKEGAFAKGMMHGFAILMSIGLQHGIPFETFYNSFHDFKMDPDWIRQMFEVLKATYGRVE